MKILLLMALATVGTGLTVPKHAWYASHIYKGDI